MTARSIRNIPILVPPVERSEEKRVAIATPIKVMIKLRVSLKSVLCLKNSIPIIKVMQGIVATKIALTDGELSFMP